MVLPGTIAEALALRQGQQALELIRAHLASGASVMDIISQCNEGLMELGERFATGECFIPELMFSGAIMRSIVAELGPLLDQQAPKRTAGKVVMGTVQHDIHDIGKDLVSMMLRGAGFEVIDLGVDVPPANFAQAVRQHQPMLVGISVLLTTCYRSVSATVAAICETGLRDQLSIMLGGTAANEQLSRVSGCDYYGATAVDGLKYACRLAGLS